MKLVTFASVILLAGFAFAFPAVKDVALFDGVFTAPTGQTQNFTEQFEITAFDEPNFTYTLKVTQTVNGVAQANDQQVKEDDLLHTDLVSYLLSNCVAQGGVLETVTVPAGTYPTCAVPTQNGGTTWVGQAPFGMIKIKNIDEKGNVVVLSLKSFVDGSVK